MSRIKNVFNKIKKTAVYKKTTYRIMAIALSVAILLGVVFGNKIVNAIWDSSQAVLINADQIENSTLAIGVYLIHISVLNEELYAKAVKSAGDSMQSNIYYKSELADGSWVDLGIAKSIGDLTLDSTSVVPNSTIEKLYFRYNTKSDGITYDLKTNKAVCIFDTDNPYDLESMEELQPLKNEYDMIKSDDDDYGVEVKKKIRQFFAETVEDNNTREIDSQIAALQKYYEVLVANEAEKAEQDKVSNVMAKLDAQRRAYVLNVLNGRLDELNTYIKDKGYRGEKKKKEKETKEGETAEEEEADKNLYSKAGEVTEAIVNSKQNVEESIITNESNMLAQGDTVLSYAEYDETKGLIRNATAPNHALCDINVKKLVTIDNINNNDIGDKEYERNYIQSDLINRAKSGFNNKLKSGINDDYRNAVRENSAQVVLKKIVKDYGTDLDSSLIQYESLLSALYDRMTIDEGIENVQGLLDKIGEFRDIIPEDAFADTANEGVTKFETWLKDKLKELFAEKGGATDGELGKLQQEKEELLQEKQKALDNNDLDKANNIDAQIQALDKKINKEQQNLANKIADLQEEIREVEKQIEEAKENSVDANSVLKDISDMDNRLDKVSEYNSLLNERNDLLNSSLENNVDNSVELGENKDALEAANTALNNAISDATGKINSLNNKLNITTDEKEKEVLTNEISGINEEIKELSNAKTALNDKYTDLIQKGTLVDTVINDRENGGNEGSENANLKKIEELDKKIGDESTKVNEAIGLLEENLLGMQSVVGDLTALANAGKEAIDDWKEYQDTLKNAEPDGSVDINKEDVAAYEAAIGEVIDKIESQADENTGLLESLNAEKSALQDLQTALEEKLKGVSDADGKLQAAKFAEIDTMEALNKFINELSDDNLKSMADDGRAALVEFREYLYGLMNEMENGNSSDDQGEEYKNKLEGIIEKIQGLIDELNSSIESENNSDKKMAMGEKSGKYTEILNTLKSEDDALKNRQSALEEKLQALKDGKADEIASIDSKIQAAEAQDAQAMEKLNSQINEINADANENISGGSDLEGLNNKLADLKEQLVNAESQLNSGSSASAELQAKEDAIKAIADSNLDDSSSEKISKAEAANIVNESIDVLANFIDTDTAFCYEQLKDIYDKVLVETSLGGNAEFDPCLEKIENLLEEQKTAIEDALSKEDEGMTGTEMDAFIDSIEESLTGGEDNEGITEEDGELSAEESDGVILVALSMYLNENVKQGSPEEAIVQSKINYYINKFTSVGNNRVYQRVNEVSQKEYVSVLALADVSRYRYIWSDSEKAATFKSLENYYCFTASKKQVKRSSKSDEYDETEKPAVFQKTLHVDEAYIYQEFGYEAFYIPNTDYAIIVDDEMLELASQIVDDMVQEGA